MHTSAEKQRVHTLGSVLTYSERDLMSEDDNIKLFAETVSPLFNEIKMGATQKTDESIFISVLLISILKTRLRIDSIWYFRY